MKKMVALAFLLGSMISYFSTPASGGGSAESKKIAYCDRKTGKDQMGADCKCPTASPKDKESKCRIIIIER